MTRSIDSLPREFYSRTPTSVAKDLIGKKFVRTLSDKTKLEGMIVETEAYGGTGDPASHAFRGPTPRNQVMFGEPGHLYVYFTYGFHYCANIVTGSFPHEQAGAVLLRGIEPTRGIEVMQSLRHTKEITNLASGPGKICQAFSIDKTKNGLDIAKKNSEIRVGSQEINDLQIATSERIGIGVGKDKLWRFCASGSRFLSRSIGASGGSKRKVNLPRT